MTYITIDQKYDLIAAPITLDGKRAKVSGALKEFATVSALPNGPAVEFSWPAVARIVEAGGKFKS